MPDQSFFGHPRALMMIFFTEMWERFGYYGMRALLILYMTKAFLFSDNKAFATYGAFTAFVYITPIIGGLLADRLLGFRLASIMGAATMAFGYFALAIPAGWIGNTGELVLYLSLALIAIGNGLFKPNTSSLVGTLYEKNDSRRDAGYTIFYMGVNTGSILAPLLCGYVGEVYGWNYGFLLTGIGLVFGLMVFIHGQKYLGNRGLPPHPEKLHQKSALGLSNLMSVSLMICVATPIIAYLLTGQLTGYVLNLTALVTLGYIALMCYQSPGEERRRVLSLLLMMVFYACFFACFEQAGSSINLFTDRNVDRHLSLALLGLQWDFIIPTTFFQAINPIFIIFFAPLIATSWVRLGKRGLEPSTPTKFVLGLLLASSGFLVLVFGARFADSQGLTSMGWLTLGYMLLTIGELAISPVGLAMISKLAPHKIMGLFMGTLMLSIAFGNYIASLLAKLASAPAGDAASYSPVDSLQIYSHAFKEVALFALAFAVILTLLTPMIKRLMNGEATKSELIEEEKETLV